MDIMRDKMTYDNDSQPETSADIEQMKAE